jgi:hypothetical protein
MKLHPVRARLHDQDLQLCIYHNAMQNSPTEPHWLSDVGLLLSSLAGALFPML